MTSSNHRALFTRASEEGLSVSFSYEKADGRRPQREVDVRWCEGVYFSGIATSATRTAASGWIDRVESAFVTGKHSRPAAAAPEDREFLGHDRFGRRQTMVRHRHGSTASSRRRPTQLQLHRVPRKGLLRRAHGAHPHRGPRRCRQRVPLNRFQTINPSDHRLHGSTLWTVAADRGGQSRLPANRPWLRSRSAGANPPL